MSIGDLNNAYGLGNYMRDGDLDARFAGPEQPAVPQSLGDYVLMPREATRVMTMAGCDSLPSCEHVFGHAGEMLRNAYRKMVEVAGREAAQVASCSEDSGPVPAYEFPYQQTFDAIAAATDVLSGPPNQKQLSISVRKFQEAFNGHRDKRVLHALGARPRDEDWLREAITYAIIDNIAVNDGLEAAVAAIMTTLTLSRPQGNTP